MYILGISCYAHEASCTLIKDGKICSVIEEERLNREKHTWKFPQNAIELCLQNEGITLQHIDKVTFFWDPDKEFSGNLTHFLRYFPASLNLLFSHSGGDELSFIARVRAMKNLGKDMQSRFGLAQPVPVEYIEHHLGHAASAFFVSEFEESAILTMDGRGESVTTLLARGRGNKIEKLKEIKVPHSLGHLFAAVTEYLGFKPMFDEWKVMGTAAYGRARRMARMESSKRR